MGSHGHRKLELYKNVNIFKCNPEQLGLKVKIRHEKLACRAGAQVCFHPEPTICERDLSAPVVVKEE